MNGLTIPPYLSPLVRLFAAHGERAYPVGGCVRDTLRGETPHDWDVAVTTPPETTVALCEAAGYRVIPTGLRHGTVTVLAPLHADPHDRGAYAPVECTTCRTEGTYTDSRHPDAVSFTGRIEDDLSRRAFTVNAMAFEVSDAGEITVMDLFGGAADLSAGIIRCVGDPATRLTEDALRILRAVRFAVRLGFDIHPDTSAAMTACAGGLSRISRERVSEEFQKILTGRDPARGLGLLVSHGLMPYVLPAGVTARRPDWSRLPADFPVRLAALLDGLEPSAAAENLAGLRLSGAVSRTASAILALLSLVRNAEPTPYASRTLRAAAASHAGETAVAVSAVRVAAACEEDPARRGTLTVLLSRIEASEAAGEPVTVAALAVGGRDLMALGYAPGASLREALEALAEEVRRDPALNTREHLLALASARLSP